MTAKKEKVCFVIMPFSKKRWEVYKYGIEPACERAGFKAVRVDQLKGIFNINRKIIEHLVESDAVVAELTDKNPNVFYEMGVAHAIDNKTIMIAQNAKDLPFDIRNYRCIIYEQSVDGLKKVEGELAEALKTIAEWRQHPSNPVQDFKPKGSFVPASELQNLHKKVQEQDALLKQAVPAQARLKALQDELQKKESDLKDARAALSTHEQALQQKDKEISTLQNKLEKQKRPQKTEAGAVHNKPLRAQAVSDLSRDAVKKMLKAHGFFDSTDNKQGTGIKHAYEPQANNEVVFDAATGLYWQQGGSQDTMTFAEAGEYINKINKENYGSYSDWRLPTLEEAMSLMEPEKKHGKLYIDPVFDAKQHWIWTADKTPAGHVWDVHFYDGLCSNVVYGDGDVRAVRS